MKILLYLSVFLLMAVTAGAKKYKLVELHTNLGIIKVKLYEDTPKHSENFLKLVKAKHYDGLLFHRVIKDFMIQGGASDSRNAPKGELVGVSDPGYTIEAEILPGHYHVKGALAAARQGDEVNPEKKSSGEQFYIVQGKVYTNKELDQIEARKLYMAQSQCGAKLYASVREEHLSYLKSGQKQKADSLVQSIQKKIDEQFAGEHSYQLSPEARELYKSVGGTPFLDGEYTVFGEVVEGLDVLDQIARVKTGKNDRPSENVVILTAKLKRK